MDSTTSTSLHPWVSRIIITEEQIKKRVKELGEQITEDYKNVSSLTCVGILKGSFIFLSGHFYLKNFVLLIFALKNIASDLVREINVPVTVEFMAVSSYGNETTSSV
jgi:hypoxanthine phosphoribosyltransferase